MQDRPPDPRARTVRAFARATGLAIVVLLALAATAVAHAGLESADPAPGSTIPETPELITAEFTDRLDPALSSLTLAAPDGTILATGGVAAEDPEARQMALRPPTLPDGVYTVGWTAVSDDDKNVETGSYTLTVATPTAPPTVAPTQAVTPAPAATPTPTPIASASAGATPEPPSATPSTAPASPTASPAPGGPGGGTGAEPVVVAIVAAIAVAVAAAAAFAWRRRGSDAAG